MRPTQLVNSTSVNNQNHNNSQSTSPSTLFKSNNQFNHNQPLGSPSLSPEINMMLNIQKNDDKSIDMVKIDEIHRAVTLGNLRNVQQLIDRKRLAFCRDQMGATPLHKAVIYGQKEIIEYFLERFPSTIHTRDNRGRTPLHYAAVLPESADLYRMLSEAGADEKSLDMFGKKPEDYLNHQDGVSVVVLRESAIVSRPLGQRRSRKSASRNIDPQSWSKIHSSRSLMHRSNIRELIKQGNIITLEEIVIQGYGDRLIGETSSAPLVQEFLKNVPSLIDQINELHKSAQRGNVNDLKSLLDRKGIVFARDQIGCTPLHKAVLYGQFEVASFLSSEYPSTLDARDHDGRTALHYAAGLDDDRMIYNVLVKNGASANLPDYKGRSAEYYLRFPDQINLQQLMKRSQRLNANYAINTANRIKSKSPCRRRGLSPDSRKPEIHLSGYKSDTGLSDHETGDADGGSSTGSVGDVSHSLLTKANLRSKPGSSLNFSSPAILREVTSANLRKWIQEADLSSLEGAILEGHGDRVKSKVEMSDQAKESPDIQNYIQETLPKVMNKIRKIHAAVSCGDLIGLQDHLDKNDYALAKDHLGMAPLHKAVILGHIDVVQFILDRFPETVNARDREGRTPLHYAAATTHKNGQKIYKVLLRSGADQRARDSVGKTAEYYRVHLLPLPAELSRLAVNSKRKNGDGHHQVLSPLHKRRGILLPSIREKISNALHEGDAGTLLELTLDGYGDALLGRASWGDESRKFLKGLPHLLDNIRTLHASISNGELSNVQRILETDPNLIRAKDENGLMAIHLAVSRDQPEIVDYLLEEFTSSCLLLKDQFGRTGLHIAAQNKQQEIYKKLLDAGGDPMIIDLRGRTADHYLKLQTTGDAYHNKLFPSSAVNNSDINNSPSKRNLSNNHNPSPVVEVKNNISDDPSVKKEISTNEIDLENGKSKSELLEIKENDTIDQQSTNDEPKPEQDETSNQKDDNENESGDQNELDDKTDEDKEVNLDETDTINTNQPIEPEIQSTVKDSPGESGQETADENIGHSGDDQVIVSDEVVKESPVDQSELVDESTEAQVTTNDGDDRETDKSNETHKSETTVEETKFEDDEGSGIKIEERTDDDKSKEKDDDLKDQLVESENIDEEKIENNRQDAVIEEKSLPKGKKISSNTKGGIKKFTSLKKTPPSSTESEKVVEDKKMKVNRKTSLPSVIGARSSSKDRLEKKKVSLNNRNGPTIGTKGIAKNVRIKEDSVNKLNEEKTENNPTIDGKSSDGTDDKIIENEHKEKDEDEEVGKMEEKLEENSENNEKEESNQPELENQNSESNLGENIPNGEDTNQGTGGDGESTDLIPIIKVEAEIVSEDETEQLASSHVDSDVERQAKEIVQGLVESSIQQAESKLSLNIGDGDVTSIQEASELIDDKVDERIKTGGTDSEASVEAAINQIEKDEEDEEIGNANGGEKSSSQPKGSKPQSAHEKEDEINLDEKSSDQSINQSNENEPSKSTAPESSEINDENNSEQSKLNENEKTESTSNEIKSDDHEISLIVEDKDEIISQNQESSREQKNQKDQQSNGNKVDDQETKLDEEHKINNENPAKSPKTSGLNGQQSGGDGQVDDNGNGAKSDQPPRSGSGKKKPKSGESSSSRLMSGSSPISNNSNDNVDMLNDLIETWLKDGDLLRLEHVVIAGQGERLIGKKSSKETVQEFLDLVPAYMAKIRNVHETVVRGNFNEVRSILTRKRFALSRDHVGSSPLHLAVLHGHMDVLVYIITQFPETLDGPDNEGRTPLHYAAVMASKDKQYYDILKKAGANPSLIDKLGHTADFYLENPHELTIGDLLSNYALKTESSSNHKEPGSVDVWQRPPTADIESRLTPSPSDSQLEEDEGPTHHEIAADVHVDANEKVPSTPTNGSGAKGKLSTSPGVAEEDVKKEVETISVQFKETLKEEKNKLQESIRQIMGSVPGQPPESLSSGEESSDERKREEVVSEYELCQVKDEHGRTVLHLVSSKPQKKVILYQMLASAEYLIPERDEKYRTIRDVAVNSALKDNVQVIDNYILDAFVRRNVGFVQRLSHEGYDLTNVVDEEGHDVTAVLRKRKITSMINLLQDITYFQKSREELHTFIKNDYIQGVLGLVDSDATLVTAKNRRSRTALHIAILFGNLDIISSLIDANPEASNVQDNLGRTPLHYAMATSKVEHIGKMLIKAGANRQIRDVKMRTPSYYFVYNDDIRAIRSEEKNLL